MKAKKIEVQPWPYGHCSWFGREPLGCKTVQAHVLLLVGSDVWVTDHGSYVALLGREMQPAERPFDIVAGVISSLASNPEERSSLLNSTTKPRAFVYEGVCHVFVVVRAHRFAPAVDDDLLRRVPLSQLKRKLSAKDKPLAAVMLAPPVEQQEALAA